MPARHLPMPDATGARIRRDQPERNHSACCEPDRHPERAGWQARVVDLLGQGVRPCVPRRTVVLAGGVEMMFSFIPPGSFLAGIPLDEAKEGEYEKRERRTTMAGFYLGTALVTFYAASGS